jgi:chemotaxis protein histidine kinase CheA
MGRNSDWSVVGMNSDPTPGDPDRVRELAEKLQAFADDASDALTKVRDLVGDDSMAQFVGQTAEAFKDRFDKVPPNLTKLYTSYDLAAEALAKYWPKLEDAQYDADSALTDATEAKADLDAAQSLLSAAATALEDAEEAAEDPDEDAVASEVRRALTDAESAHSSAESTVASAQERLEAAKALAQQAKEVREEAAEACANDLDEASDAGMQNKKWWQKAVDWVVDNWDTIVEIAKIVVAVLGIIVMIIGGPLAWIVLAAALIVLADTLIDYANGNASLWDVAFAALDCIPGFKGLTTAGGLLRALKDAPSALQNVRKGLGNVAESVRSVAHTARGVSRNITDGVMEALKKANPQVIRRSYTPDQGHYYATRVLAGGRADGQTVLSGHGWLRRSGGDFVVPEGTSISFYSNHGQSLHGLDGVAVEGGLYRSN